MTHKRKPKQPHKGWKSAARKRKERERRVTKAKPARTEPDQGPDVLGIPKGEE
jgi:hypothetical protein